MVTSQVHRIRNPKLNLAQDRVHMIHPRYAMVDTSG